MAADGFEVFAVDEFHAGARLEVPRRFGKHFLIIFIPENEPVLIVQQDNGLRQAIYHLAELGVVGHRVLPRRFGSRNSLTELNLGLSSAPCGQELCLPAFGANPSAAPVITRGMVSATASVPRAKPSASRSVTPA